jgi:hypothetical protein
LDQATKSILQFGLIGLALAGGVLGGLQARPAAVLPFEGTVSVSLVSDLVLAPGSQGCRGGCSGVLMNITIDSVMVHRTGELNLTGAWFTISKGSASVDLASLRACVSCERSRPAGLLIGGSNIPPGIVNLVRLNLSSAFATVNATGHVVAVKIPGGRVDVLVGSRGEIRSGKATIILLDFPSEVVCEGESGMCQLMPVLVSSVLGPG